MTPPLPPPRIGSLFSGIGGFDLAFQQAGARTAWLCEHDPACQAVLRRHFPGVPIYDDVTTLDGTTAPPVDVVVGGFPCQDLSVAGDRAGLDGARSGLWWQQHRLLKQLKPRWVVIENVPGLLSAHGGWDFARLLWGLEECGYHVAWRVLDAQYFGLAQRRRRVFLVGYLGDGRAASVLFERDSVPGDFAAGGEAGADLAGSITAGIRAGGGGCSQGDRGLLVARAVGTRHTRLDPNGEELVITPCLTGGAGTARTGGETEAGYLVAHTLTASAGHHGHSSPRDGAYDNLVVGALDTMQGGPDDNSAQAGHLVPAIAQSNRGRGGGPAEQSRAGSHGALPMVLAFTERGRADGRALESQADLAYALLSPNGGGDPTKRQIAGTFGVRRLMPLECERLQGFPDGWTADQPDSPRYKQLGNAVAVPVVTWIARRLIAADAEGRAA